MFRPVRLLLLAIMAFLVYVGFFALPPGSTDRDAFQPDRVAAYEADAWMAVKTHSDFAAFFNFLMMERELHHFTWFRAAQAAYSLTRAEIGFQNQHGHYDTLLPDLAAALSVEKAWHDESFDVDATARAHLNWWVSLRNPNLNSLDQIAALIDEEYTLRYRLGEGQMNAAAIARAEAVTTREAGGIEPDWNGVRRHLVDCYRAIQAALKRSRAPRRAF